MPSILFNDNRVSFIARKRFKQKGEVYTTGDDVTELMRDHPKLEVFVRNGYIVPVVESEEDIPFQFRHTVMTRERANIRLARGNPSGQAEGKFLGRAPKAEPQPGGDEDGFGGDAPEPADDQPGAPENDEFDPAAHDVDEVMEYVEEHPDEVLSVYALEESGKQRSTLLKKLDKILNKQAEDENSEGDSDD